MNQNNGFFPLRFLHSCATEFFSHTLLPIWQPVKTAKAYQRFRFLEKVTVKTQMLPPRKVQILLFDIELCKSGRVIHNFEVSQGVNMFVGSSILVVVLFRLASNQHMRGKKKFVLFIDSIDN